MGLEGKEHLNESFTDFVKFRKFFEAWDMKTMEQGMRAAKSILKTHFTMDFVVS